MHSWLSQERSFKFFSVFSTEAVAILANFMTAISYRKRNLLAISLPHLLSMSDFHERFKKETSMV